MTKKPVVKKAKASSFLVVVFDTETTGLIEHMSLPLDKQPEIIEFHAVVADLTTWKIKKELDLLIRPLRLPLPPKITKITGITDEMLVGKPSFLEVSQQVSKILTSAPVAIAHNASFDRDMVELEFQRIRTPMAWPRLVCTIESTIHLRGCRLSLDALHQELFGETMDGAHRARSDVKALLRCAVELRKRGMT